MVAMAGSPRWLLLVYLGFAAAWMDERPVLDSRDGNLFISAARDRNITLKILGDGYVNVNEINLLHVASAAQNATRLIERWRTGYLAEVESNLQRLTQIVEGPEGLERRMAAFRGIGEDVSQPGTASRNQSTTTVNVKVRLLAQRVRRLEDKVRTMEKKLKENDCASNPCQNGGTCQDLYEGYQCLCPSNWEGPNCMTDVNECIRLLGTDLGCQNGATCFNLPGSYRCDCAAGWHGLHCTTKTSACNTQNSNELCGHGVCVSKPSSPLGYTCICDQGWEADGANPACIKDVDECAGNHRPCSVNPWVACRNAPGTFFCDSCPSGYTGNGYYCRDIDECLENNGGCSTAPQVSCINTLGSRMCGSCPPGYTGNGVTCSYVGGCAINHGGCHPLATCVENPGLTSAHVLCRCPNGYSGNGIGPNGCQRAPDVAVGWGCSSNPCVHGTCVPGAVAQAYTCTCLPGYTGTTCNVQIDACTPNPCRNSGVCKISNGAVACDCPTMFTGSRCETPRQTCGGVSRNPVGRLEFPIGGNVYQHGLSCAWLLVTNSSLVLNVTFTRFNLEQSVDCKYDFLQIHDGGNAGSHTIGRFCGSTLPHSNGNIVSSHNALYLWFYSDSSISHDGFAFQWNSMEPVCGGILTDDYGTISSPGSPGRYPPNRDCYWKITVRIGKRIQFHFGQLMLEAHPTCGNDYLEITGIDDERLGIYCNHTRPPPFIAPGSEVTLHFHSDSANQDAGFQIHYSIVEGVPGCSGVFTAPTGVINPPMQSDSYQHNMQCEWKIQMPVGERIQITWSKFDLEQSGNCRFDFVEIYDGETTEAPLLGRFCGDTIPPTLKSNTNALLVVFESDMTLEMGGFSLSYNIICGGEFTAETGILHSPMYPNSYHRSRTCLYDIVQPQGKRIVLEMMDMDIEGLTPPDCYFDELSIFDGDNENATKLATLCGDHEYMPTEPYYSTHNYMLLKFTTDGTVQGRGFKANYTTIDSKCGGLYKTQNGMIQTPNKDGVYPDDLDCIWTIQAPPGYVVQLTFLTFELEQNSRCRHDYIAIYENIDTSNTEDRLGIFCGSRKPPILITQGNIMQILFHSDSTIGRAGFVATYIFIDAAKVCGGHFVKSNGILKSPNYPKNYPNRRECVWVLEAPNKHKVVLNVEKFKLESHSSCSFDYLEIRNGGYDTSPIIGKFCGSEIPTEIISQTNQLYLKFVSDASRPNEGFLINWDSTTLGCGGTLTGSNGDIMSPNYPQPYHQESDCNWKISVAEGNLVRLLIVDLDLENHARCRFDYIEVYEGFNRRSGQKYCNSPYPKVISAHTNMVTVRFRSDFTNSGRGFHLKYETLCENTVRGFYGVIESPNFPNKYEHNQNCSWIINAPIGNRINISFSHFDLEGSNRNHSCPYDYLLVEEGRDNVPNTQLAKLCDSNVLPAKIHSTQNQVFLKFVTDFLLVGNGFRLEWVVDGCGGHLTKPSDSFTSPGYPFSYPTNVECEWLIEVDYMHSVMLTIHDINTEKQKNCYFDKLQIFSGEDEHGLKLVEICYSEHPVVYTSSGNKMFLKFHSDVSYSARGFKVSYRSVPITCGGQYTADVGIIHSANYPQNYPHKQNCEWLLQVSQNYIVNLTFLDFDLEKTINCTDDYIQLYDGSTRNSPLLATLCGNVMPPSFVSTSNEMLVVMRTDSLLSAKGFKAKYFNGCGARIIVRDQGYLTPTKNYNADMLEGGVNCTWTLIAEDPADHVTATFTHIEFNEDLFDTDNCNWNYLEVHEGESIDGPSRGKWCDNVVPLPLTSTGNALTVRLSAMYDFLGHFAITYSVLNSACGGTYTSYRGKIASPGYPNSYPLNAECVWILNNSPGNRLSLTFSQFDLQPSENCDLDYLEIREDSGMGKLISVSCGTSIQSVTSSSKLWIKFKSDGDSVAQGFVGEYSFQGGNELFGPTGRITSPLYPLPYKRRDTTSWRVTVDFQWVIRIDIKDLFVENSGPTCFSYLRIYDGYNNEAPQLLEVCNTDNVEPITSNNNVIYIELVTEVLRLGSWFDLTWLQVPSQVEGNNVEEKLSDCVKEVGLMGARNNTYDFSSPGWPQGYADNLHCVWLFTSPPGTHLVLRILVMDLEESTDCNMDALTIYDGNALANTNDAKLVQKLCLSNSTSLWIKSSNVMTVKFDSDNYINKTGFSAYVYRDCGGKLEGPNGEIQIDNTTSIRPTWQYSCEWIVEVKPGRTIEVKFIDMAIQQGSNAGCSDNYLMLKNGGEPASPILGTGKYCGDVVPAPLQTTGNRLYVKAVGARLNINFKLTYREVGINCGGDYVLTNTNLEISTPNYPNIPPPFSDCTWKVMAPSRERISIHFVDRFDLSSSIGCEREYVEVRDGGTDNSKLLGRFCKDVAPSSMASTGNMMYVHFYTDTPDPKNGFKAIFSAGEVCGGILRGSSGVINSPNYPFFYPKNQTCIWWVIAPEDHSLKFEFRDMNLPGFRFCKNTDHVQISEKLPENNTRTDIGTYCGITKPEIIETSTNEAIVTFKSDHFDYTLYRGFSLNFSSSQEVCGGEFTEMSGIIKSNGYPNVATRSRYCDWRIKLPKGYQVVVDILDLDIIALPEPVRFGYSLSFYNDFRFKSRIKVIGLRDNIQRVQSSGNTMMIGYSSSPGYRGFKLRYSAAAPPPCGGIIKNVRGNLSAPTVPPFNESSYFCVWSIEAPESMANNVNNTGLSLSVKVTGVLGVTPLGVRTMSRFCLNYQYIALSDTGNFCGNFSEPVYLRSPNLVNELTLVNGTYGKRMNFNIEYQWQPCGGIFTGLSHAITAPRNISFPINCIWHFNYPDTGETIKLYFTRLRMNTTGTNYISVKRGGQFATELRRFQAHMKPMNVTSISNLLWVEYYAEQPNDFEFVVEPANHGCGGALRGNSREISSPQYPSLYPNNAECTWEIIGDNGYHVGLVFVDRFNLETSVDCKNDYVEMFDWVNETEGYKWQSLGKVCGRNVPKPYNSTSNRMKVTFRSNELIQAEGFRALWYENCGGVFNVTKNEKIIQSPSYPNLYEPNLFCNYTLVAPQDDIVVHFMTFQLERSRRDCRFDNLTMSWEQYGMTSQETYCGENKPLTQKFKNRVEIIFQTDKYIERSGFMFKYFVNECGGNITSPTEIGPPMMGDEYFGGVSCTWYIRAPSDKNVVVRFDSFLVEYSGRCYFDYVEVFDGETVDEQNRMALLCGNLTEHLPVFKSQNNTLVVRFYADDSRHHAGFKAKILFAKSVRAGCGGQINLTSTVPQAFMTQRGSMYESLEDCHWSVVTSPGKIIKFTINSMDVKNSTNKIGNGDKCSGDYLEVRDGIGPFSQLLGRYCGNQVPPPVLSSTNNLWIRFFSDGTVEGAGVSGTLMAVDGSCGVAPILKQGATHVLTSPNYPNPYGLGSKCRWVIRSENIERIRVQFLDFDVAGSARCNKDYVQITDSANQNYIDEGFGQNFIWNGKDKNSYYLGPYNPSSSYRYCGSELPHVYYSYSGELEVMFKGDSMNRGFKLEYSAASCDRNYTTEQGRIVYKGSADCWITITAPANHTIALYFNSFVVFDPDECTKSAIQIYDGSFNGKLLLTACGLEIPKPVFSTGNMLSMRWWSQLIVDTYDITFTTTDKGRGCGGRLYNYAGTFSSPLYPNEYRNNTVCSWDVSVPPSMKVVLEFLVFDIGGRNDCEHNTVKIFTMMANGDQVLANTYCGGDNPASFEAETNRIIVTYISTVNNIGTGWLANFRAVPGSHVEVV